MIGTLNNSSKKSFKGYLIPVIVLMVAVVSILFYINSTKFNEGLIEVKSLVTQGKFEEATNAVNNLKETNKLYLAINTTDLDGISTAIEEHQSCVLNEYPTYAGHSGIAGCVFWMRHNDKEKKELWSNQFKQQEDEEYCSNKYEGSNNNGGYVPVSFRFDGTAYSDPKCSYSAFKEMKRKQNWDYLVSEEWDGFTEYCALESCPLPEELKF